MIKNKYKNQKNNINKTKKLKLNIKEKWNIYPEEKFLIRISTYLINHSKKTYSLKEGLNEYKLLEWILNYGFLDKNERNLKFEKEEDFCKSNLSFFLNKKDINEY